MTNDRQLMFNRCFCVSICSSQWLSPLLGRGEEGGKIKLGGGSQQTMKAGGLWIPLSVPEGTPRVRRRAVCLNHAVRRLAPKVNREAGPGDDGAKAGAIHHPRSMQSKPRNQKNNNAQRIGPMCAPCSRCVCARKCVRGCMHTNVRVIGVCTLARARVQ